MPDLKSLIAEDPIQAEIDALLESACEGRTVKADPLGAIRRKERIMSNLHNEIPEVLNMAPLHAFRSSELVEAFELESNLDKKTMIHVLLELSETGRIKRVGDHTFQSIWIDELMEGVDEIFECDQWPEEDRKRFLQNRLDVKRQRMETDAAIHEALYGKS